MQAIMRTEANRVIRIRGAQSAPRIRLICFPYAGGNPEEFRAWADEIAPDVELLTIRLPGHGSRIRERPHADWEPLLDDVVTALAPYLAEPHALYGHSFGGRLAYEVAHLVEDEYAGRTRWLFVSGCRSPDWPQRRPFMFEQSDPELRATLRQMGGMPDELLADNKLMKMLLPTIRGEFRGDRHGYGVNVPITAVYGRYDEIDDRAAMRGWPIFSRHRGELLEIPGGHFFFATHRRDLITIINTRLGVIRWAE